VADRLQRFNGVRGEVRYPPVHGPERFTCVGFNEEIVCIARLEHHKRQHLLIDALGHTRTPVKLRLAGVASSRAYVDELNRKAESAGVADRVRIDDCWISEDEKLRCLAECLAAAYVPVDEDSYGYPSLESSHASKPVLTTRDSGGVMELIQDGVNGYVTEPDPRALAEAMDLLYSNRDRTVSMGREAHRRIEQLDISWPNVLHKLLA